MHIQGGSLPGGATAAGSSQVQPENAGRSQGPGELQLLWAGRRGPRAPQEGELQAQRTSLMRVAAGLGTLWGVSYLLCYYLE